MSVAIVAILFFICIVVLLKLLADAGKVPELGTLEARFELFDGSELAIRLVIGPAEATLDVKRASIITLILLWPESKRVIVHELGLREIVAGSVSLKVHCFIQNFLDHRDIRMIVIVRHWNHCS